jgi:hypothetical protein
MFSTVSFSLNTLGIFVSNFLNLNYCAMPGNQTHGKTVPAADFECATPIHRGKPLYI